MPQRALRPEANSAAKQDPLPTARYTGDWDELLEAADAVAVRELEQRSAQLEPDDPINIQYTSGTTGFPKGATLSHHNILNNGYFIGEACKYSELDRVCIPVPFYHCFGMVLGNLACTTHGSAMKVRQAFGRSIGSYQAVAFKCADMAVAAETARQMTYTAAALKDAGQPFRKEAAIVKLYATEAAVAATREATQIFGGYGFIDETPVARFYRDAKILEIGEGTSEIQRLVISRELGLGTAT